MSEQEIALSFSMGKFNDVFPVLSENAEWEIIETSIFRGKKEIISNCLEVSNFFNSVATNFCIHSIESIENKIAISGTAEFKKGEKIISQIEAFDVYAFNHLKRLEKIYSYCIINKTK